MRYLTAFATMAGLMLAACDGTPDGSASDSPVLLWELSGFQNPESARPDPKSNVIYVSNVAGDGTDKNGNGFISKVSPDGKMIAEKWVTGLDAPKGIALAGDRLYVSDIDRLVEIDVMSAAVVAKYDAPGAKFLNDVAADEAGNIYVTGMMTDTIWRLSNGKFEAWLASDALINPNGLYVDGPNLIVAPWGKRTDGPVTEVPGHLLKVSIADKTITSLGSGAPVGNLDGIEAIDSDTFLVSDWMSGKVYMISRSGKAEEVLSLGQGAADLGYDPASKTAYIPLMKKNKLQAYRIE